MPKLPPLLSPPILDAVLVIDPPRLWAKVAGSRLITMQRRAAAIMHIACQTDILLLELNWQKNNWRPSCLARITCFTRTLNLATVMAKHTC